jgi:hypothetical protein
MFGIPGGWHLAAVVGLAVGSAALSKFLRSKGNVMMADTVDLVAWIAGGLITLDLLRDFFHTAAQIFHLYF